MRDGLIKFTEFKGIQTSIANPDPNAFQALINLRSDSKIGGLVPRFGIRHLHNEEPSTFTTVDDFVYNDFGDIQSQVVLGKNSTDNVFGIYTTPGFQGGVQTSNTVNITGTIITSVASLGSSPTLLFTPTNTAPGQDYLYTIARNVSRTSHVFRVITAVNGNELTVNRAMDWAVGETIVFYKTDMLACSTDTNWGDGNQLNYTILTKPQMFNIAGKNDIGIYGVSENIFNENLWLGRITNRKYFGPYGFSFNGIYATTQMDDFTHGAFVGANSHIQVKTSTAVAGSQTILANSVYASGAWTNFAGGAIALADLSDGSDATGVKNNAGLSFFLQLAIAPPTIQIDALGNVSFRTRLQYTEPNIDATFTITLTDFTTGVPIPVATNPGRVSHLWTNSFTVARSSTWFNLEALVVPVAAIPNIYKMGLNISASHPTGVSLQISELSIFVPATGITAIVPSVPTSFVFSFSEMYDDFSESPLIYNGTYGDIKLESATYVDSNATLINATSAKTITIKITTDRAELVNRRITELRLYCATYASGAIVGNTAKDYVWRIVRRIRMDSGDWVQSGNSYYVELQLGVEVLSGEIYQDRTTYAPSDTLTRKSYYATYTNNRVFIRNDVDKSTVYYSAICANGMSTSAIPASNFFILSKTQEEIVGLSNVNRRLIVWKKHSLWTVNIDGLPDTPVDDYISIEKGLASFQSIALANRLIFFNSYDGIYYTDGFKLSSVLNLEWREEYLAYTTAQKEAAIGYYDTFTDTYVIYIAGKIWAYDTKVGYWRNESWFTRQTLPQGGFFGPTFGIPSVTAKAFDGRVNFFAINEGHFYQYPRDDNSYVDAFTFDGSSTTTVNQTCTMQTVDQRADAGIDEYAYTNNGYVQSTGLATGLVGSMIMSVNDNTSTTIATNLITTDRQLIHLKSTVPISRHSVKLLFTIQSYVNILEFGVYVKILKRTGSVLAT